MRRVAVGLALAVAATLCALGLAEAVLRLRAQAASTGTHSLHRLEPGRPWIFGLRPGARSTLAVSGDVIYEINADGFRDRLHPRRKPAGSFRIAVLGDSLAFGYGVALEQSFPKQMERDLGPGFEVMNFGVGAYNPYNEAALLEGVVLDYAPDLVLVQFCINDLNDPVLAMDAATRFHLGVLPDEVFPDPAERRHSRSLLPPSLWGLCARLELCLLVERALNASLFAEDSIARLAPLETLPPGPVRSWLARHYTRMAELSRGAGAGFAVALFPFEGQVTRREAPRLAGQLVALGREQGWTTLDLLPAFRRAARESPDPLFLDLWHLTGRGNRVAARAIVEGLARRGLLPGDRGGAAPRR